MKTGGKGLRTRGKLEKEVTGRNLEWMQSIEIKKLGLSRGGKCRRG